MLCYRHTHPFFTLPPNPPLLRAYLADHNPDLAFSQSQILESLPSVHQTRNIYLAGGVLAVIGICLALGLGVLASEDTTGVILDVAGNTNAFIGFVIGLGIFFGGLALTYIANNRRILHANIVSCGDGLTLAMGCCLEGPRALPSLRLLIEAHADLTLETTNGTTALRLAQANGRFPPNILSELRVAENAPLASIA